MWKQIFLATALLSACPYGAIAQSPVTYCNQLLDQERRECDSKYNKVTDQIDCKVAVQNAWSECVMQRNAATTTCPWKRDDGTCAPK